MKKIIPFFLTLLFINGVMGQSLIKKKPNSLAELNLKGKVKQLVETEYNAVERYGRIDKGDNLGYSIYLFNKQGNKIERGSYNPDGSTKTLKSLFKYNNRGDCIETIMITEKGDSISDKNAVTPKTVFTYDKNGNCTQWISHNENGEFMNKVISKYDGFGNVILSEFFMQPNKWATKTISKYDTHHHETVHISYIEDGTLLSTYTHKYDSKGNEIEQLGYNKDGGLIFMERYEYSYDRHFNWTRRLVYKVNVLNSVNDRKIVTV